MNNKELILHSLQLYQNKLQEENLNTNNLNLFEINLDTITQIIRLKEIIKENEPIFTINGKKVSKKELKEYLEMNDNHIPYID